ncbi:MAG TPA: serine/threonine-protein kinase, partial [Kofleriaceae bacterium]|nr:serine/threonine-protein kinase [Kofleriaceae bacterium]
MASVYEARDRISGGVVALKVMHTGDDWRIEHFEREAALLAGLDHPGIVRHVAHGRAGDGQLYLVMEWLEGQTLAERLRRGPLPASDTVELAAQVAEALGAAHAAGVVHRDIKPSNLFLCGDGVDRVKILDFGVARFGAGQARTLTGVTVGTPGYMAPEQARGARELDGRADLFSLGCVLYECLCGKPAFAGEHVMAVLAKILLAEIPSLAETVADVPPVVEELLARLLAKDPDGRPVDAPSVAAQLRGVDLSAPVQPRDWARGSGAVLTSGEQQLLAVVMAGGPTSAGAEGATAPTLWAANVPETLEAVRQAVSALGGHLEQLVGGALV